MAKRLYSLFEKRPHRDGTPEKPKFYYERISQAAYYKETAVRVFQSALLAPYLGDIHSAPVLGTRCLRVVKQ